MKAQPKSFWWAVASVVVMVLGAFGPWARVLGLISVNGTDGDGWIVIVAGLIAAGLIVLRQRRERGIWLLALALLAAVIAAATAIYDWNDLSRVANETGLIEAGWGIYLATIGSVSLALACIGLAVETRAQGRRTRSPASERITLQLMTSAPKGALVSASSRYAAKASASRLQRRWALEGLFLSSGSTHLYRRARDRRLRQRRPCGREE